MLVGYGHRESVSLFFALKFAPAGFQSGAVPYPYAGRSICSLMALGLQGVLCSRYEVGTFRVRAIPELHTHQQGSDLIWVSRHYDGYQYMGRKSLTSV